MGSISIPTALLGSAALSAAGGLASGIMGSNAAGDAANAQIAAGDRALAQSNMMFQTTQNNLRPYIEAGPDALKQLQALTGTGEGGNPLTAPLTKPFEMTQAQLESTPGYQFTRDQGLKAVQNSYAAQGLARSGPALRGAADYATGLADSTYGNQFSRYWTQNQNMYNMLSDLTKTGAQAAMGQGQIASGVAGTNAGIIGNQGAAQAGGIVGGTNALTSGIGAITGAGNNAALLMALNNNGMFGTPNANNSLVPTAKTMPFGNYSDAYGGR